MRTSAPLAGPGTSSLTPTPRPPQGPPNSTSASQACRLTEGGKIRRITQIQYQWPLGDHKASRQTRSMTAFEQFSPRTCPSVTPEQCPNLVNPMPEGAEAMIFFPMPDQTMPRLQGLSSASALAVPN